MQLTQQILDGDWIVTANARDECDFTTADEMGRIDALLGMPCNPLEYFAKLSDVELYIIAWKDTTATLPLTHVDYAGELEDLQEDMTDRHFWAGGCQ